MSQFVSTAAIRVNRSGRSPLLTEDSFHQLFVSLSLFLLCTYVVDSQKSSKIVMFPIICKYKPHKETLGSKPRVCAFMMSEKTLPIPRDGNCHFDTQESY